MFDIAQFLQSKTKIVRVTQKEIFLESCPNCGKAQNHTSSFSVNRQKPTSYCFRCNKSFSWVNLIVKYGNLSYEDAHRLIGNYRPAPIKKEEKKLVVNPLPPRSGWTIAAERYILSRLSPDTVRDFGLYYCSVGKYQGRIIIPVFWKDKAMTFQARAIDKKVEPRYRSPFDSPKSLLLYNLDNYRNQKEVVITEGPFDVLRLHEHGIFAVCPLGKSISSEQIKLLTNLNIRDIVLMQDRDALSGVKKVWKSLSRVFRVKIAPVLEANDPGEMSQEQTRVTLASAGATVRDINRIRMLRWRKLRSSPHQG